MSDDFDDFDVIATSPEGATAQSKPRRGRPPGSRNSTKKTAPEHQKYILDTATALSGLICFWGGLDADLAPTREELEKIILPLFRILERRVKLLSKLGPDAEDAALALAGLIGYVIRAATVARVKRSIQSAINGNASNQFTFTTAPREPFQQPRNNDNLTQFYDSLVKPSAGSRDGNVPVGSESSA